tara:strand:+ start:46 stop:594 length:549 start_codon:yes stop_codon:yes gene_type:complete
LNYNPTLVLNSDFRPLSYFPLSLWSWQETIKAVFLERVNILSEYNDIIHSPSFAIKLPSVISLKEYVKQTRNPAFTRFNVFLRDSFSCQYCNLSFPTQQLTFDHVIPKSKGGKTTWTNVVTACQKCNFKKGNKLLKSSEVHLFRKPQRPNTWIIQQNGRSFPPNFLHESWRDYLYWDTELET